MSEHVQAIRDFAYDLGLNRGIPSGHLHAAANRLEELEDIVAQLPKTADGVPIVPGMMVYNHTGKVGFRVATYGGDDGKGGCLWYAAYGDHAVYAPVYSTREAAEAAREGGAE